MARLIIVVLCLMMAGCGSTLQVGVGAAGSLFGGDDHVGRQPYAHFEIDKKFNDKVGCKAVHFSSVLDGPPFNSNFEKTFDYAGCYVFLDTEGL